MQDKELNAELNRKIGVRVKDQREEMKLKRSELAERVGISEYFLIEIETGRKGCSFITLCKLSEALCITTDYLLTGKDPDGDVTKIVSMLSTVDNELIVGAEDLLKTYLNSISYIKSKIDTNTKSINK